MVRLCRGPIMAAMILPASCVFPQMIYAEESAPAVVDPLPKGYDESFQTGDIPKPNSPDLDPDQEGETELNPDVNPDQNPLNDPDRDNVVDNFMIGGTASLTFPHMTNLGLESIVYQKVGLSLNYGDATRSLKNVDVNIKHTDFRIRWFPWSGSFFTGLAIGHHQLTGQLDRQVTDPVSKAMVATHGKLVASANYVIPHIGWFTVWKGGFTFGCDIGYLLPSKAKSTFSSTFANSSPDTDKLLTETNEYKKMKKDLEDSAKSYASAKSPFASLLRIGWMF